MVKASPAALGNDAFASGSGLHFKCSPPCPQGWTGQKGVLTHPGSLSLTAFPHSTPLTPCPQSLLQVPGVWPFSTHCSWFQGFSLLQGPMRAGRTGPRHPARKADPPSRVGKMERRGFTFHPGRVHGVSTTDRRYLQTPEGPNAALITSRTGRAAERGPGLRAVWFPHAVPPARPLENTCLCLWEASAMCPVDTLSPGSQCAVT